MLAITERERSADDAQRCGDGRYRAGGVLCCPPLRRRCVSEMDWGVRTLGFRLQTSPQAMAPGSLTPQPPSVVCHRRCPSPVPSSGAPAVSCRLCDRLGRSSGKTRDYRSGRSRAVSGARACVRPSRKRAWSCARRRARLVASLRPRAWSARGLRALTPPARSSPDRNCVTAPSCLSSAIQTMPVAGNRPQVDTPPVDRQRPRLEHCRD